MDNIYTAILAHYSDRFSYDEASNSVVDNDTGEIVVMLNRDSTYYVATSFREELSAYFTDKIPVRRILRRERKEKIATIEGDKKLGLKMTISDMSLRDFADIIGAQWDNVSVGYNPKRMLWEASLRSEDSERKFFGKEIEARTLEELLTKIIEVSL